MESLQYDHVPLCRGARDMITTCPSHKRAWILKCRSITKHDVINDTAEYDDRQTHFCSAVTFKVAVT